jgi:hypothetical protein
MPDDTCVLPIIIIIIDDDDDNDDDMYNKTQSWFRCEYKNELYLSTNTTPPLLWKCLVVQATHKNIL